MGVMGIKSSRSEPVVVEVAEGSAGERAGVETGDIVRLMNAKRPRDVIEYSLLADPAVVDLVVTRGSGDVMLRVEKQEGEPLGIEVSSALFDRVTTCDNHCAFCFIHQLPKGMRRSLYLKDDDYRLSFLYGNFTTLTRFSEMDLERVLDERLSPLYVSIHATDPELRARLLRNPRGATSLRWLRALLDGGIEVHGQVVVCPGVNDGSILEDTLAGILDMYPELASVAVVPLGISRESTDASMRPHSRAEAEQALSTIGAYQEVFLEALARRMVFAADEYYLMSGRPFPPSGEYEGFPQHENGVGIARAFHDSFFGDHDLARGARSGFFSSVDGAPASGYRAVRAPQATGKSPTAPCTCCASSPCARSVSPDPSVLHSRASDGSCRTARDGRETIVVTGGYGGDVLRPLLDEANLCEVKLLVVENSFFGGNIAVAGLMAGCDVARALSGVSDGANPRPNPAANREVNPRADPGSDPGANPGVRVLLPDVCLSGGRFLDGLTVDDLPCAVEVVPSDGESLRRALLGGQPGGQLESPAVEVSISEKMSTAVRSVG